MAIVSRVFAQKNVQPSESLFAAVTRLERLQKAGPLTAEQRSLAASLAILQGDCVKLRKIYKDNREPQVPLTLEDTDRLCACDGRCDILAVASGGGRMQQALYVFRQMLGSGRTLKDPQVAQLWGRLNQHPESKYLVFRRFRSSTVAEDRTLAEQSWNDLSKLNMRLK